METKRKNTACMLGYFSYETDARVKKYVQFLVQETFSVDVICLGKQDYVSYEDNGSVVSVFPLRDRKGKEKSKIEYLWNVLQFFILAMWKVSIFHLNKRYQFIHVHNVPDFLVFTAWMPKMFRSHVILDIHDILPEFYARKFKTGLNSLAIRVLLFIEKISCKFSNHVIIANDTWRDKIAKRSVERTKCTSIPNFPDRNAFFPKGKVEKQSKNVPFTIVYHGTLSEHHGLDIAIKAMGMLKNKIGAFRFLIYGGGPTEIEMQSLIDSMGLADCVSIEGPVPYHNVPEVLKNADIGVVPKKDGVFAGEALSTKLFEYAAMGIPSVVSRTEAEMRYFNETEVKYFNAGDPEDMAKCIQELYENPEDRYRISQRALRKIDDYSLYNNKREYLEIIKSFQKNRRTQSEEKTK